MMNARLPGLAALVAAALAGIGPPARASTLFGLVDTGEIYASTNHGAAWTIRATLPVHDAAGLRAGLTTSELRLLSRGGVVWLSMDAGFGWAATGAVPASDCVDMVYRADGRLLVLTATGTIWKSADGGIAWDVLATRTASNFAGLVSRTDGRLFAVTRTGEVDASLDLGASWTAIGTLPVPDVAACRASGSTLYLLTSSGTVWRSIDDGRNWSAVGATNQLGARGLTVDEGILTAATREGHIYRSNDGVDWAAIGSINQIGLMALADDAPGVSGVPETARPPLLLLTAAWPNPCPSGEALTFGFRLARPALIGLDIFDVAGRLVAARPPEWFAGAPEDIHWILWRPDRMPAGVYLARVQGEPGPAATVKITLRR